MTDVNHAFIRRLMTDVNHAFIRRSTADVNQVFTRRSTADVNQVFTRRSTADVNRVVKKWWCTYVATLVTHNPKFYEAVPHASLLVERMPVTAKQSVRGFIEH
ncbi:hypothetical protein BBBOND_0207700 [Babesia bigemina]|uniref:Uncharacterized protein n=1 Tax=Babesia bigemina TaxID=5866 RepID=A0A061DCJ9_BABBI|nr:hypothetical protein BBBOND_0207700 [Babesia bigemina]CDR95615.1 hypothetical protein BBBOND_0207700 [Babesia bigemina]|eukprot:XP_012767801.1 hypothetical protein BBBOND_0207700 [Babesia bigemina]